MKPSKKSVCAVTVFAAVVMSSVAAQSPEPKPAFAGQTDAPLPAKPSSPFVVQPVAGGLTGAWAFAFLEKLLADRKERIRYVRQAPDGSIYVIASAGILRLTPKK